MQEIYDQDFNDRDIRSSSNHKRFEKVCILSGKILNSEYFIISRVFIYNQYLLKKQKKKVDKLQVS